MVYHMPVLLKESVEGLAIRPDGLYVDVSFGGGSHTRAILAKLQNGQVIAFDQDEDALKNRIDDQRLLLLNHNFRYLKNYLRYYGKIPVDGILADLGVSSHQLDVPNRGFSTRFNGDLDMRMDRRKELTAGQILNGYAEEQLVSLFTDYGEITNARKLARVIMQERAKELLKTTEDFKDAISACVPAGSENKYLAQVFQALRIEVNQELEALKDMLQQALQVLRPGGRMVVLTYHSLEDRLVKNFIKSGNIGGNVEKDFYGKSLQPFRVITRKPVVAGPQELASNPRSRSAKLRIAEKL
jgi:16S rRNA (cytosine1402-N4)-methyltransferase